MRLTRLKAVSWRQIGMLLIGAMILAFGMHDVHSRCRITEGGVLGMTLLIKRWTGLSPAVSEVALDALCYALGARCLGWGFLPRAALATAAYAAFYALFDAAGYALRDLSGMPLAAALVGALFVGVGVGLVVRAGGAAGGDDALALTISKAAKWPVGRCYLVTDVTVLLLSLSYIPIGNILCSLISVTLSSAIIGLIHDGRVPRGGIRLFSGPLRSARRRFAIRRRDLQGRRRR